MLDEKLLQCVEKAMQGDQKAFIKLCEMKGTDILYIAISIMGNVQDGEDAAQEILVCIHNKIKDLKDPHAFNTWLYRVTRTVCIDMMRKNKRSKELISFEDDEIEVMEDRSEFLPDEFLEDSTKREQLLRVVKELPLDCKMCVLMFYFDGMKYIEIGNALGMTKKEVDNTLMKSKRLIRRALEKTLDQKDITISAYGIAQVPVLAQILRTSVKAVVPGQSINAFMKSGEALAESVIAAEAGGTVAGSSGSGSSAGGSTGSGSASGTAASGNAAAGAIGAGLKLGICLLIAAGITAGYIYYENSGNDNEKAEEIPQEVTAATPEEEERVPRPLAETADDEEEEIEINTLEDMLGEVSASELRTYQDSNISRSELEDFLAANGMKLEESIWRPETKEEDSLYVLAKQDKLLMVITRYSSENGKVEFVFEFTERQEIYPESIEISLIYDRWK